MHVPPAQSYWQLYELTQQITIVWIDLTEQQLDVVAKRSQPTGDDRFAEVAEETLRRQSFSDLPTMFRIMQLPVELREFRVSARERPTRCPLA